MHDHYETLQVHPKADQETIQAAYERLRQRYAPDALAGAADELVAVARRKREAIEHAYAVLSDPTRRATYDAEQQAATAPPSPEPTTPEEALDYGPLPPANRQERPQAFNAQPLASARPPAPRSGRRVLTRTGEKLPAWFAPAMVVGVLTFVVMLASLLLTNGGRPRYANDTSALQGAAQTTDQQDGQADQGGGDHSQLIAEYESHVVTARQVVEQAPDNPNAWIRLGNALYDSVQVVRELQPESAAYTELLPRWLEASQAYQQALELASSAATAGQDELIVRPASVRSDMGVSLCYYGTGTATPDYVAQGLDHTRQAVAELNEDGRALLNLGICLVSTQPPQTEEALELWRAVLELPAIERGVSVQARQLVEEYSQ